MLLAGVMHVEEMEAFLIFDEIDARLAAGLINLPGNLFMSVIITTI